MNLVFDANSHAYFLDGKEIPSVTQIIKSAGLMPDYGKMRIEPANYGTKVHKACADIIADKEPDMDMFVKIAVEGFKEWQNLYKPTFHTSEKTGASEKYQYAGTCDIGAMINKKNWLVDIKTGSYSDWHIIQLAAYNEIFHGYKFQKFAGLYLDPVHEGKYKFKEISKPEIQAGFSVFLNALNIYKWKRNHNGN